MKKTALSLFAIFTVFAALLAPNPASAAIECIQIDGSVPAVFCSGQPAQLGLAVTNSCDSPKRLQLEFELDDHAMEGKAAFVAAANLALVTEVTVTVPRKVMPGTHSLTVAARDEAGGETSIELEITVESCPKR